MPQRTDIKNILLIGSGPIVIGQACEFDYSGTQAAKTLKSLGYRVVLINSNPATIMTDPDFAHRTYIEPITKEVITNIIAQEKIDAILPTMGGQTALNVAMEMYESGALEGVKFLGANPAAIKKGEDRQAFKEAMLKIGMDLPKSHYAYNEDEALQAAQNIGFPLIIRASYTLAGGGSGVAYNIEEFKALAKAGLEASPINEILIEESLLGWKEFEMEVIRDKNDNCIIVCSIENLDPMGVHTGDSITIAPALTLTDKEYQRMRDASFKILREIGVDTGGSNVQFAINPKNGRMTVIEMNPRVSRSSALASKATGYPIAKVATMLAVGFSLDEISNDITGTPASFEPSIDYIVTKIPRFAFEKFPLADSTLTTSMKSIGEVMAIGGCFKESLQKALCSLENGLCGFDSITSDIELAKRESRRPNANRILYVADCFRLGLSIDEVAELSQIDKWFLSQIYELVSEEGRVSSEILRDSQAMRNLKSQGFSDKMLARLLAQNEGIEMSEGEIYMARKEMGVVARYEEVDTCAAEFPSLTNYLYSTIPTNPLDNSSLLKKAELLGGHCADLLDFESSQTPKSSSLPKSSKNSTSTTANTRIVEYANPSLRESRSDSRQSTNTNDIDCHDLTSSSLAMTSGEDSTKSANAQNAQKVLIIGGGPNRIGQGIEFDYCCVHSSFALRDLGVQSIMYNCNPETVSTDYDTSDTLYFEPIDFERVRAVIEREKPDGIIVHFGGQTPLKLAKNLTTIGAKIIGTKASVIDTAEDREKFAAFAQKLSLNQPQNGSATSKDEAFDIAHKIGYPVLVRPSYVLGGRAMRIVQSDEELRVYMDEAVKVSEDSPVLIDKFLDHATELDVDAICDGEEVYIGGIMQHIEEAGVHSGDSTSVLPSISIDEKMLGAIRTKTEQIALELGIIGLLNIQYAIYQNTLYIIEVNPRASRTVPFVSKATGIPLAKVATRVMWLTNSACGDFSQVVPSAHFVNGRTSPISSFASHNHENSHTILEFDSKATPTSTTANTRICDSSIESAKSKNSPSLVEGARGWVKTPSLRDSAQSAESWQSKQNKDANSSNKGILREALRFYDTYNRIDFTTKPLSHKALNHISVKESIFPFNKLNGADLILGPEMKSTGEVMGISSRFGISFAKAQNASKNTLPKDGKVFISLADCDKEFALSVASKFINLGFSVCATSGTHRILEQAGIPISCVLKISEGRPNIKDLIMNKEIALVINTSDGAQSTNDAKSIRRQVLKSSIPYFTTIAAAEAAAESIKEIQQHDSNIPKALQDFM